MASTSAALQSAAAPPPAAQQSSLPAYLRGKPRSFLEAADLLLHVQGRTFPAHRLLLAGQSQLLADLLDACCAAGPGGQGAGADGLRNAVAGGGGDGGGSSSEAAKGAGGCCAGDRAPGIPLITLVAQHSQAAGGGGGGGGPRGGPHADLPPGQPGVSAEDFELFLSALYSLGGPFPALRTVGRRERRLLALLPANK